MFAKQHRVSKIIEVEAFLEYIKEWERKKERKFQSSSVAAFVKYVRLRDLAYREKRDKEDDAIQIMTVHGAKGLEFDTVIIPHSFESEFPMTMKTSNIEEERRLFYVAATRAISKLIITSCMQRQLPTGIRFNTEVSRFLDEGGLQ
jgi:DNA helicase-2/ATP-dependent DNA helicase PcrA